MKSSNVRVNNIGLNYFDLKRVINWEYFNNLYIIYTTYYFYYLFYFISYFMESSVDESKFFICLSNELKTRDSLKDNVIKDIVKEISEFFISHNDDISPQDMKFKKDSNITSNSVYFIFKKFENVSKPKYVLKVRREASPLPYENELEYKSKMEERGLIPTQYFQKNISEDLKINIEEFIDISHVRDEEAYNVNVMNILISNLVSLNTIDFLYINETESNLLNNSNFYFHFLIKKILPYSKCKIEELIKILNLLSETTELAKLYLADNKYLLDNIKSFYDKIPEYFNKLVSNIKNKNILVFSHIDVHCKNFFITDQQSFKFIDFEDLSFCFAGFDLANYILESEYTLSDQDHSDYPYYKFVNSFTEDMILKNFTDYFDELNLKCINNKIDVKFDKYDISDIYKLFCMSVIKSVTEYIFMVDSDVYLKKDIDFVFIIRDRINAFTKYYSQI